MALIKKSDFKKMGEKELIEKMSELNKDLIKARMQISNKVLPDNPGRVKYVKRTIAKIKTKLGGIKK